MSKRCPNCKLINPPDAIRCDCGYDFATGFVEAPATHSAPPPFAKRLKLATKALVIFSVSLFATVVIDAYRGSLVGNPAVVVGQLVGETIATFAVALLLSALIPGRAGVVVGAIIALIISFFAWFDVWFTGHV